MVCSEEMFGGDATFLGFFLGENGILDDFGLWKVASARGHCPGKLSLRVARVFIQSETCVHILKFLEHSEGSYIEFDDRI